MTEISAELQTGQSAKEVLIKQSDHALDIAEA
jgi:hypothetical protein